jgi:iron complex transport system substrate-binding protein
MWWVAGCAVLAVVAALWLAPSTSSSVADGPTRRVVSLSPGITETIAYLGAGDRLVGRSDWCTHPASVTALPALGSSMTPNYEALAALEVDHVFVEANNSTPLGELQAVAPTTALPWLTLDEVTGSVVVLGKALGAEERGNQLVEALQTTLGPSPLADAPRVLLVLAGPELGQGELWFVRRNSLHGRVLHAAGGRNAIDEDVTGSPTLSLEGLVQLQPDVILVLANADLDPEASTRLRTAFDLLEPLNAPRHGRVGVVAKEGLLSTGPGILDMVALVHAALDGMAL